jgi:hypothetical protein
MEKLLANMEEKTDCRLRLLSLSASKVASFERSAINKARMLMESGHLDIRNILKIAHFLKYPAAISRICSNAAIS